MKAQQKRFWILVIFLVLGGGVINVWERAGEARVERQPLKDFPTEIGAWKRFGSDVRFDAATEAVLRADDYVMRDYLRSDGRVANFYVGYYATQRAGATYHSPLNCLPGSGWTMSEPGLVRITPTNGAPTFEANRYIIENGENRELMIYWYQGRGRAVASEYWDKVYTVIDSAQRRRSDGAMVRVMVPVGDAEAEALATATEMAGQVSGLLYSGFVPE